MRDPQTRGARMTHRGLAVASPYGIVEVNRTTAESTSSRRGRACATRRPAAPA